MFSESVSERVTWVLFGKREKKKNDCREKLEKDGKGRTFTWEIGRKERWGVKSKAENFEPSCF